MDLHATDGREQLMDAQEISVLISSIAGMICKDNPNTAENELILIGLQRGGIPLAERLAAEIENRTGRPCLKGTLDIAMYRDDIGMRKTLPRIFETDIPFDINGRTIVLVDDVLQSGRSIRAALDAITYYGRPAVVRLAVLLDRGMREFPIQGDYVGKTISVSSDRRIRLNWSELSENKKDYVYSIPNTKTGSLK